MSDELYSYYNRELKFMGQMCADFAEANKGAAPHLRMEQDTAKDPHVARLVEAFAYLNARTRRKLDDEFPELTDALLGILYPHYLAPIPSMAIVRFALDRQQGGLTAGYRIKSGSTIEAVPVPGVEYFPCQFRTCYPVHLWPIEVSSAGLGGPPFQAPHTPLTRRARSVLRLELKCFDAGVTFADLPVDSLRFYLHARPPDVYALYELLLNTDHTLGIAVANAPNDTACQILDRDHIRAVGFAPDECMLEYPNRSFLGYRLLSEYFTFPQKFLFFDINGLGQEGLSRIGSTLYLYLFFARELSGSSLVVSRETFQLGCCPAVNLFRKSAEPFDLTQTDSEYHVVPDERNLEAYEIYDINAVVATSPANEEIEYRPFYALRHFEAAQEQQAFWYATRRPRDYFRGKPEYGTEVYLSFVNLDMDAAQRTDWTIAVDTTCLNRDLPHDLPFGDERFWFQLAGGGPIEPIRCLTEPTVTLRPAQRRETLWRVISHLSLNHLSLVDNGADALREILNLYDFRDSPNTRNRIESIVEVRCEDRVNRIITREGHHTVCRGSEVIIEFDEKGGRGGTYLFASVLERFLTLYSSVNSFMALTATSKQREEPIRKWEPRHGDKVLL